MHADTVFEANSFKAQFEAESEVAKSLQNAADNCYERLNKTTGELKDFQHQVDELKNEVAERDRKSKPPEDTRSIETMNATVEDLRQKLMLLCDTGLRGSASCDEGSYCPSYTKKSCSPSRGKSSNRSSTDFSTVQSGECHPHAREKDEAEDPTDQWNTRYWSQVDWDMYLSDHFPQQDDWGPYLLDEGRGHRR